MRHENLHRTEDKPSVPAGLFAVTPSAPGPSSHGRAGHLSASWSCSGRRWEAPAPAVAASVRLGTEPPESHPDVAEDGKKIGFRIRQVTQINNHTWSGQIIWKVAKYKLGRCLHGLTSKTLHIPGISRLTAWVESISLMEWSYCSAKMASLRCCSCFSRLRTALCSDFGVVSNRWFLSALYCLVWILHVSWNCFLICSSLDCRKWFHYVYFHIKK